MYRSLKAVDLDVEDAADADNAADEAVPAAAGTSGESAAPLDFVPCGWFVYKTMGPSTKREFRSHLLELGDWPKNKRNGSGASDSARASARELDAKQKEGERWSDTKNERGMPKKEQILVNQTEANMDQRRHESNILALSQVLDSLHKRVDIYSKLIGGLGAASQATMMNQISDLMSEITENEKLMLVMTTKKRRTLADDPPLLTVS
jgi:hypothetical protein